MAYGELETVISGDWEDDDMDLDGLGARGGVGRRRRALRRLARMRKREGRLRSRAGLVTPGRTRTTMQKYRLPSGQVVCPGPNDIIHISDEPIYDVAFITSFAAGALLWPMSFFAARTRQTNGYAITNILTAGNFNYDVDVEAISVSFFAIDQHLATANLAVQQFYEILARGVLKLNIEERDNYVFPIRDCPSGTGLAGYVQTTETNMRAIVGIQNGDPGKGRRKLMNPIAFTKNTHFSVELQVSQADQALIAALTPNPTLAIGVGLALHGPEGVPLVPASSGGLYNPEGMATAAKMRG